MNTVSVNITIDTRLARAWIWLMRIARPVIGAERACRWAEAGVRLVRYRVEGGKWRFL